MRVSVAQLVAAPLLLTYCGAKQDLLIGDVALVGEAGGGGAMSAGGAGGDAPVGGNGGVGGGAAGVGGGSGSAGEVTGGVAGEPGVGGAPSTCNGDEEPPLDSLLHRYSFDGTGTTVVDSIGGADGNLVGGAMLDGSGTLTLPGNRDGQPDQYLDLPDALISGLSEVTLVAWTTWDGGAGYQRVFDFGISDLGEQQGNSGRSYIAVMPSTGFANGTGLGAEVAAPGFATLQLPSEQDIQDRLAMVALTYRSAIEVELYLDGQSLIRSPTQVALSDIQDDNNWVGQSQWSKDHAYNGSYDEVRIYGVALNGCQLQTITERGPGAI